MTPNLTAPLDLLRLTRLIMAPVETVFDAWIDPDIRRQWWAASPEMSCGDCSIDAEVGGSYRISMCKGDEQHTTVGKFVELDRPHKLSFTWSWENQPGFAENSLVTVELHAVEHDGAPATELVLVHEKLTTAVERSEHTTGWFGCLGMLTQLLTPQPAGA